MNDQQKRKDELLGEMARRFRESANTLRAIARRIDDASVVNDDTLRRLNRAGERLRECLDCETGPLPFTYLEFVEFTTGEEFRKFRDMPVITQDELGAVDLDSLCNRLLAG